MSSQYASTFLRDAAEILRLLRDNPRGEGAARALHSLKSASAFLGWEKLEEEAHRLESSLAEHSELTQEDVNRLEQLLDDASLDAPTESQEARLLWFNQQEQQILDDAQQRGEGFYRMVCRIHSSEPLPFPRAYLLSSRFETEMNLVKTHPPMDAEDADFSRPVFWFTTDLPESEIYHLADVDLVDVVELVSLDYEELNDYVQPQTTTEGETSDSHRELTVDWRCYSDILALAEELTWRLEQRTASPEAALAAETLGALDDLAHRPLEPLLENLRMGALRVAHRRGLEVCFDWEVASGGLDSPTLDALGEILRQLIRNSLRHGMEGSEERIALGKKETGSLKLQVERSGSSYIVRYSDDGRGIDEEAILGHRAENSDVLLSALCVPGFSTLDESDHDGGRGMGMDMIRRLVALEFESELSLINKPGKGVEFSWSIPEKRMKRPYLVFEAEGQKWALPSQAVNRRGMLDPTRLDAIGQSFLVGERRLPLVGPYGRRPPGNPPAYFLEVRHRGRRAVLPVDDLISEEPWGHDDLQEMDPASPWCRALAGSSGTIPVLSPAIVYAANRGLDDSEVLNSTSAPPSQSLV
ncbi:MAG: ATP-binding protein [Spirochaetales bacterium]|nr:ATP-binding protein [Spirochaetales bacterium]